MRQTIYQEHVGFESGSKMMSPTVDLPDNMMSDSAKKSGIAKTFGQRLAVLRKSADYSRREFAMEIGGSHRIVAYNEAQTDQPPAQLLPTIVKALHLSTDQVLCLEPVQKRQPPLNQQLLRKMKEVEALPPRDQRPFPRTVDSYLKGAEKQQVIRTS